MSLFVDNNVPKQDWLDQRKQFWDQETSRENVFLNKMVDAKEECEKILDLDRRIHFPVHHAHTYEDKYSLADFVGIGTIAAVLKFFQKLGMEIYSPVFAQLKEQVKTKSVTLRFNSREDCTLLKKEVVERELSSTTFFGLVSQRTTKEVTIYTYKIEAWISLEIFIGNNPDQSIVLQEEHMECVRKLEDTETPPHKLTKNEPIDLNVTWLFQHLDAENKVFFCVDRNAQDCFTPTRNEEIVTAGEFMKRFKNFCTGVNNYFFNTLFPLDIAPFSSPSLAIFVPILPIFEEEQQIEKKQEEEDIEGDETEEIITEELVTPRGGEGGEGGEKRKRRIGRKGKGKEKGEDKDKDKEKKKKIKGLFSVKKRDSKDKMWAGGKKKKGKGGLAGEEKEKDQERAGKEKKERMESIHKVMGNLLVFYGGDNEEHQEVALKESVSLFHSFHKEEERISLVPFHLLPQFLSEQSRTIKERMKEIENQFRSKTSLHTATALKIVCMVSHGIKLAEAFIESVNHIERILYKQFVAAIGKQINFVDFDEYMRFHVRKIYQKGHNPSAFSWPVKVFSAGRVPEGVITIQQNFNSPRPIMTASRAFKASTAMKVVLNAASTAQMWGERHIHLWTAYQFDSQEVPLSLVARAKEYSSFILILGTVPTKNVFDPSHAIIIKDKDELILPLLLETIPTAKEFKAKVNSLSPEQQAFSKAYRALQLASTLFGVMVLPIEPQLEKLLNLPRDTLAKELELQKDIMDLMIEHDIPSSLLSCDEEKVLSGPEKVQEVQKNVTAMRNIIFPPPTPPSSPASISPVDYLGDSLDNSLLCDLNELENCKSGYAPRQRGRLGNTSFNAYCIEDEECEEELEGCYDDSDDDFSEEEDASFGFSLGGLAGGGGGRGGYGFNNNNNNNHRHQSKIVECNDGMKLEKSAPPPKLEQDISFSRRKNDDDDRVMKKGAKSRGKKEYKEKEKESAPKARESSKRMKSEVVTKHEKQDKTDFKKKANKLEKMEDKKEEMKEETKEEKKDENKKDKEEKKDEEKKDEEKKDEEKKDEEKKDEEKKDEEKKEDEDRQEERGEESEEREKEEEIDFVSLPNKLEAEHERLGLDHCVRPTIIKPGTDWTRKRQQSLLSDAEQGTLTTENLVEEKKKSYDLLDALSRSGVMSFEHVTLHIVIGSTVQFEKCLIDTVIQENLNPIEVSERANFVASSLVENGLPFESFLN